MKSDEKKSIIIRLNNKTSFSLIFIQDLGNDWTETVGQSAYYSIQTDKKAGIVLILETIKERKYWFRLNTTIDHFNLPIDTWSIEDVAY